jgi:hypothetical protein
MKRAQKIECSVGVVVLMIGALAYNTGGFGAVSRAGSAAVTASVPAATLIIDDVSVTGDPGGTALGEVVIDMQPGDVRERLVRFRSPATGLASLGFVSYSVSGTLISEDASFTTIAGVGMPGDATNVLAATNAGATAGATPLDASAGQGGLAVELYFCDTPWVRADGAIASRFDDIDYQCPASPEPGWTNNGFLVAPLIDIPATGSSSPVLVEDVSEVIADLSATQAGSPPVLVRVRFVNDGTTNGRQNPLQRETVQLTHRFTASQAFDTTPAVR